MDQVTPRARRPLEGRAPILFVQQEESPPWRRMPTACCEEDGVEIDKRLGVPLVPIDDPLQEQSEDGVEKGEKHDRLCWPNDQSPVAGPRTSGVGSSLTAQGSPKASRKLREKWPADIAAVAASAGTSSGLA